MPSARELSGIAHARVREAMEMAARNARANQTAHQRLSAAIVTRLRKVLEAPSPVAGGGASKAKGQ